jgi:hypothetical protein
VSGSECGGFGVGAGVGAGEGSDGLNMLSTHSNKSNKNFMI